MHNIKQYCRFCGDPLSTVHEWKDGNCSSCLRLRKDTRVVLRKRNRRSLFYASKHKDKIGMYGCTAQWISCAKVTDNQWKNQQPSACLRLGWYATSAVFPTVCNRGRMQHSQPLQKGCQSSHRPRYMKSESSEDKPDEIKAGLFHRKHNNSKPYPPHRSEVQLLRRCGL